MSNNSNQWTHLFIILLVIQETFKRRLRTSHIWLEKNNSPQLSERENIQPLTINRREEGGAFSSDQSEDDETLASVAAQKAAAVTLKRKSPRLVEENAKKPAVTVSAVQSGSGKMKKRSPDIFLSMADPYYKQTIFHYFEQRKKGQTTTVQATKEIFSKFQNFLKKSKGDFYKSEHKGGEQCLVDNNDVVIRSKSLVVIFNACQILNDFLPMPLHMNIKKLKLI